MVPAFNPLLFGIELFFSIIILFLCFMIFFKTKESYDLTNHKNIKFFRYAFLFFGLSYLMRFLFMVVKIFFDIHLFKGILGSLFILSLSYLSTIAIFYLGLSVIRKKLKFNHLIILSHFIAVLLALVSFIMKRSLILIYTQSFFLIVFIILISIKHKKRKSSIKIIYILIFILWLINLWAIVPGKVLLIEYKILFHAISIGLFGVVYYKISKWLK